MSVATRDMNDRYRSTAYVGEIRSFNGWNGTEDPSLATFNAISKRHRTSAEQNNYAIGGIPLCFLEWLNFNLLKTPHQHAGVAASVDFDSEVMWNTALAVVVNLHSSSLSLLVVADFCRRAVSVCPSVLLSVTFVYCVITSSNVFHRHVATPF